MLDSNTIQISPLWSLRCLVIREAIRQIRIRYVQIRRADQCIIGPYQAVRILFSNKSGGYFRQGLQNRVAFQISRYNRSLIRNFSWFCHIMNAAQLNRSATAIYTDMTLFLLPPCCI